MIEKTILCGFGLLKLIIYKIFHWNKMNINIQTIIFPSVSIQLDKNAKISLGKGVSIRKNCELNARGNAEIVIGNKSFLNSGCIITAHKGIKLGENVEFGPNVLVFDHDHKFKEKYEPREFDCEEIIIGDNVWVGAGTIILRGTKIGSNSVVAAGSVVKGTIPQKSLYYNKREKHLSSIVSEEV